MQENGREYEAGSYMEYYDKNIKPIIMELDIAIKAKRRLNNKQIGEILGISEKEVREIRLVHNIKNINGSAIVKIMEFGTSEICAIFKREMETGSPFTYTKEQIAYIYGLDIDSVNAACGTLNVKEITWQSINNVFSAIPYRS